VYLEGSNNYWGFTNISLANHATMQAVAAVINRYAHGWDGIFIDILIPKLLNAAQDGGASMLDWRRMGFATEAAFLASWEAGGKLLVSLLQPKPISTNYGTGFAEANGHMCEDFPRLNGGTWQKNMDGLWQAPHAAPKGSWICSGFSGYDPTSPENLRRHRFGLASACLADAFHSFGRYENDARWCVERLNFWYDEYHHPQRGKGWLGEPIEAAHQSRSDKFIWMREFQHGIVVVNTDTISKHSIYLPHRYRPFGQAAKDSWNLAPQDALIMEAV
jgi:putative glycosyl hydrolase-like family 15 (GHL15) protein